MAGIRRAMQENNHRRVFNARFDVTEFNARGEIGLFGFAIRNSGIGKAKAEQNDTHRHEKAVVWVDTTHQQAPLINTHLPNIAEMQDYEKPSSGNKCDY